MDTEKKILLIHSKDLCIYNNCSELTHEIIACIPFIMRERQAIYKATTLYSKYCLEVAHELVLKYILWYNITRNETIKRTRRKVEK